MAAETMAAQKAHTHLKRMEVCQNPSTLERWVGGQPIRKTLWTRALKRAGVRYCYQYQTRQTYASIILSSGNHSMGVAQQMDRADWSMIIWLY
jgi:integrase